jgi:hypothetical protein
MYTYTKSQFETFVLLQTGIEVSQGSKDAKTSPYCSASVILMCLGIAKVDKQSISQELGDVTVIALHNLSTGCLISTDDVPVLFGIELRGEFRGVHQVAEHHGELAAFGVRRGRHDWGGLALRRRDVRRGRQRH